MLKFVALYRTPEDRAEFDRSYFGEHIPLVSATPGLRRAEIARVTKTAVGEPEYYVMAEMYFDDMDSFVQASKAQSWLDAGANLQKSGAMKLVTMFVADVVDETGNPV